jgi:hypothetical protein
VDEWQLRGLVARGLLALRLPLGLALPLGPQRTPALAAAPGVAEVRGADRVLTHAGTTARR